MCILSLFDEEDLPEEKPKSNSSPIEENDIVFNECYLGLKESEKRKRRTLNKHPLPSDTPVEGRFQIPKVSAYTSSVPDVFIPYSARVCYNSEYKGVYCNIDDPGFSSTWTKPISALRKVQHYSVAVAPDHTLWVDASICENVEQIRRSRTTQIFWQNNGVPTIQVASWGDAESVRTYAFDGLAENSWTAFGHQRVGNSAEQRLFEYAVRTLVEVKQPIGLLVFGAPLGFDPGVPVIIKPSFISKLRNL